MTESLKITTEKTTETGTADAAFDPKPYRHFLDDCGVDFTDAQKDAFIANLQEIIVGIIDFGLGVHPVQQALKVRNSVDRDSYVVIPSKTVSEIFNTKTLASVGAPSSEREDS